MSRTFDVTYRNIVVVSPHAAPSRVRSAERRAQLQEIAQRLLDEEGAAAVTMERVAAEAGVGKPIVYRQFQNRIDLLFALLEDDWARLDRAELEALSVDDPGDRLRARVRGYFDAIVRRKDLVVELDPDVERRRATRRAQVIARYRDDAIARHGIAPDVAEVGAAILIAASEGAAKYALDHPRRRALAEEMVVQLTTAFFETVGGTTGESS